MTTCKNIPVCGARTVALAALLLAACGPDDEPVDVEPMEPGEREVPVLGGTGPEHTPLDNEMDPTRSRAIDDPEQYMLAEAEIAPVGTSGVSGNVRFDQRGEVLEISGRITGLEPGSHGLHIHENGDCSGPGAITAGAHFSPEGDPHGSPREPDARHHAGDLGNITADDDGNADFEFVDTELKLGSGSNSVIGRAVVVHADADDLASQPAGDPGLRVGCAVIRPSLQPAYVPE